MTFYIEGIIFGDGWSLSFASVNVTSCSALTGLENGHGALFPGLPARASMLRAFSACQIYQKMVFVNAILAISPAG
jgi:hypothetical protein